MLGLYVSDHPLFGLERVLAARADSTIAQLPATDGAILTIGGIVSGLQHRMTKQGNAWAIATVEDLTGSIDCMFFPATYQLVATQLAEDAVVFVRGRLDRREDVPRLVAMELTVADLAAAGDNAPVRLEMREAHVTPESIRRLKEVLQSHPGPTEVHLRVPGRTRTTVYRLGYRIAADPTFWSDLKAAVPVKTPLT
jgi:DNA polymerase III subunit alpha